MTELEEQFHKLNKPSKTMDDALVDLYRATKEHRNIARDEYFKKVINGDNHIIYKTPKQLLELAIKICEDYSEDKYKLYKGYPPYKGDEPERAWEYTEGLSDGSSQCADKIRELLEELNK